MYIYPNTKDHAFSQLPKFVFSFRDVIKTSQKRCPAASAAKNHGSILTSSGRSFTIA